MKLKHENYDEITLISVQGDMTADELQPFTQFAEQCLDDSTRDFVIDIAEMGFIDSKGLETLIWLQEQAAEQLGQVRLAQPSETVAKILEITRLEHQFDTHDTVDDAIKSLR